MCTGLRYINDGFYFGRNLDLDYTFGQSIVITPKNYEIKFKHEKSIANHYAFIGVAVVVEDYPLYADAINEAGLGIANLNFPHFAEYATEVQEGQLNLAPYELMLYALANCQSVAEVKTAFSNLNVVDIPFNAQMPNTTLHWFVADKKQAAVIEVIQGKVKITDNPANVLTNSPSIDYHLMNLAHYANLSDQQPTNQPFDMPPFGEGFGAIGLPGDWSPASRFVKAAFVNKHAISEKDEISNVTQFFHILDSVAFVEGVTTSPRGTHDLTMYASCGHTESGNYYYKTYRNNQINCVSMSKVDLQSHTLFNYPMIDTQQIHQVN